MKLGLREMYSVMDSELTKPMIAIERDKNAHL